MQKIPNRTNHKRLAAFSALWRVIHALILRDVRTRWGSAPAYIITFMWPLVHIFVLVIIWVFVGRIAPYGESNILWFSVSMLPFMTFSYVSRFLIVHIIRNKPALQFPIIKMTDLLFSGLILEVFNICVVIILMCAILWYIGVNFIPFDPLQAFLAIATSAALGLGAGIVNALIGLVLPMWITGYFLLIIVLWIISGVLFVPASMPIEITSLLYYLPTIHIVEWMRESFYPGYNSPILDKNFVVWYSFLLISIGLSIERFARGKIILS